MSVKDATATTQPADANLPPLEHRDVNKTVSQFPDKVDLTTPETAWAASRRDTVV